MRRAKLEPHEECLTESAGVAASLSQIDLTGDSIVHNLTTILMEAGDDLFLLREIGKRIQETT